MGTVNSIPVGLNHEMFIILAINIVQVMHQSIIDI